MNVGCFQPMKKPKKNNTNSLKGTSTNIKGEYLISILESFPITLSVSYLGYKNTEVKISNKRPKPIKLFPDNKNLQEVKVVDSRITQKQKESILCWGQMRQSTLSIMC